MDRFFPVKKAVETVTVQDYRCRSTGSWFKPYWRHIFAGDDVPQIFVFLGAIAIFGRKKNFFPIFLPDTQPDPAPPPSDPPIPPPPPLLILHLILAKRPICGAGTGAARGCCSGSGVSGTGPGSGTGWSRPPPPARRTPPPPFVGGQHRRRSAAVRLGGARQRVGQTVRGAPRSAGVRQPVCRPAGGGALEPWLHSASAVIGRGGRPTPHSRTCTCGRGWGSAQPEVWAGSLLRGSHIGRRPGSFRRAAIRWGGGGGKGLIYLYTAVYR